VDELPGGPRQALTEPLEECVRLGFTPRFAEALPCAGDAESFGLMLANREGTMFAALTCARIVRRIDVFVTFGSRLTNGVRMATSSAPRRLLSPPGAESVHLKGAPPAELLRAHQLRLLEVGDAWPMTMNDEQLRQFVHENEMHMLEFHERRGVWARMTVAEVDRLRAAVPLSLE
jgi:hypothetical protein